MVLIFFTIFVLLIKNNVKLYNMSIIDTKSLKETTEKASTHTFCEWIKNLNKEKAESKEMSVDAISIIDKFKINAETAAKLAQGYAEVVVLTQNDFNLTSKVGFGFNDITNESIKEAYTELSKTEGLVVHAIPQIKSMTDIKVHIVATWDNTPLDTIRTWALSEQRASLIAFANKEKATTEKFGDNAKFLVDLKAKTELELKAMSVEIKALTEAEQENIILFYLDNQVDVGDSKIKDFLLEFTDLLKALRIKNKPLKTS